MIETVLSPHEARRSAVDWADAQVPQRATIRRRALH